MKREIATQIDYNFSPVILSMYILHPFVYYVALNKWSFMADEMSTCRYYKKYTYFRSHTGEKPFQCKYMCNKKFSNSSDRAKHEQTHKDPVSTSFIVATLLYN